MNTKPVTFNMPQALHQQLRIFVGPNKMSRFVCQAIGEKMLHEKKKLKEAYLEARGDVSRQRTSRDWDLLDTESWA